MNYKEVMACFPESAKFAYWGVTQEELDTLTVDHWMGQYKGTMYLGTPVEILELSEKQMLSN